jgi:hypothetical protein
MENSDTPQDRPKKAVRKAPRRKTANISGPRPKAKSPAPRRAAKKAAPQAPVRTAVAARPAAIRPQRNFRPFPSPGGDIRWFEYAIWFLLLAAGITGYILFHRAYYNKIFLAPVKTAYYHDDFLRVTLSSRNKGWIRDWQAAPPVIKLLSPSGEEQRGPGGLDRFYMTYDAARKEWDGVFPCPWNAPPGKYAAALGGDYDGQKPSAEIDITRRVPAKIPPHFVVLTMEYANDYGSMRIKSPDGKVIGREAVALWARHLGADAVWVLVGKTEGHCGQPWNPVDFDAVHDLAIQCHKHGLKFGVWTMCYLTHIQDGNFFPRYQWALEVENGAPVKVRSISLLDPTRPDDIADMLLKFKAMKEVDYLGLDYIRNALGGYELMDRFYQEMPWAPKPAGWDKLGEQRRMAAFASMKIARKDHDFIDAWQWWRAHRVGEIVRHIKSRVGSDKPMWAFTLGWEKGWQHGQDPVMMNDAGIDMDSVMLYEATSDQFADMLKDWSGYIRRGDVQIVAGNVIDWPLHQDKGLPEYRLRFSKAMRGMYGDGNSKGIFIHDLTRLIGGRKGPLSTEQWAESTRAVISEFRSLKDK